MTKKKKQTGEYPEHCTKIKMVSVTYRGKRSSVPVHCGQPSVGGEGPTGWCEEHSKPEPPKEEQQ